MFLIKINRCDTNFFDFYEINLKFSYYLLGLFRYSLESWMIVQFLPFFHKNIKNLSVNFIYDFLISYNRQQELTNS